MATKKATTMERRAEQSEREMARYFQNCPKVAMRLYRDPEQAESDNTAYAEAAINGRVFLVRRGVTVEVPAPLYTLFRQAGERFDVE